MASIDELKEKIRREIIEFLVNRNISYEQKGDDYRSVMLQLLNIDRKWIPIKPRRVVTSKELLAKLDSLPDSIRELEKTFKNKFEDGSNINGHLSKNIYFANNNDRLLDKWCIHHLHLCCNDAEEKSDMSMNRSGYYLLFLVENNTVYFLDIVKHLKGNEFANYKFIKIIINNGWHELVPIIEIPNAVGLQYDSIYKDDIYKIWGSNINFLFYNIDDKYYCIGKGVSLSGDNMGDIETVNSFENYLFDLSLEQNVSIKNVSVMDRDCILFLEVDINGKTRQYKIISEHGANRCLLK